MERADVKRLQADGRLRLTAHQLCAQVSAWCFPRCELVTASSRCRQNAHREKAHHTDILQAAARAGSSLSLLLLLLTRRCWCYRATNTPLLALAAAAAATSTPPPPHTTHHTP